MNKLQSHSPTRLAWPVVGLLFPVAQYFGTKGFFHDYNARMNEPLKATTGKAWSEGSAKLRQGRLDPTAQAHIIAEAEEGTVATKTMTRGEFVARLPASSSPSGEAAEIITRGEAMTSLFQALSPDTKNKH